MRQVLVGLSMLVGLAAPASAQFSIGIGLPGMSIGISVPLFPELDRVPGYPVYYAPGMQSNYFFYDGMYWVYQGDDWYASDWYDGPWGRVSPEVVPLFVLRVPVRYYRSPPSYFSGWRADAPPRWGEHWGPSWQQQRNGWDRWNRQSAPAPAPLPTYQRQYREDRYPQAAQQQALRGQNYRYRPRDPVVRQHFQEQAPPRAAAPPTAAQAPQRQDPVRATAPARAPALQEPVRPPPAVPREQAREQARPQPQQQPPPAREQARETARDQVREQPPQANRRQDQPQESPRQRDKGKDERDNGDERGQERRK